MQSPFRYPGGKSKLAPMLAGWFRQHRASVLLEPFAGGASVSLYAVANRWVDRAVLVEKDPAIAAFWRYVFRDRSRAKLLAAIGAITDPIIRASEGPGSGDDMSAAIWAICRNRTSFGGVITTRGGVASERKKYPEKDAPRWNRETLIQRIEAIGAMASRLTVIQGEALDALRADRQAAAFIDPPYPTVGKRLYRHHDLDHDALLIEVATRGTAALATYGSDPGIIDQARELGLAVEPFTVAGNFRKSEEVMIGADLGWWRPQGTLFPPSNIVAPARKDISQCQMAGLPLDLALS
jgi:DNA adenine methylase